MKVFKVAQREKSAEKTERVKVAVIRFTPGSHKPYTVQVWINGSMKRSEYFITKTAAIGWIDLNHPTAKLNDLTPTGKPLSSACV